RMNQNYETSVDRKSRWGGFLEHPLVSRWQRNCLDYGRIEGLCQALKSYPYQTLLDVGCGGGEGEMVSKGFYCGIDNSFTRVHFAKQNLLSRLFYSLDRGGCFRQIDQMTRLLEKIEGLRLLEIIPFKTFPRLYLHAAFILQITG